MKILITGITGLFGSYLAKEFAKLGEIHGLRRSTSSMKLLEGVPFDIVWHEGNLHTVDSLDRALQGMDLVVHAAGLVSFDTADASRLHKTNVTGTANLVNAMLDSDVKKLIHVSSVAALGRSTEIQCIDENFKWADSPLNTDYGRSKYLGELEAWRGEQEGLELIVVNPSILLGQVSDMRSSSDIFHYVLKEHSYYPEGDLNYIDVRDAARQTRQLAEMGVWGERYILNKEKIAYREFFRQMADVLGKKAPSKPIGPLTLKIVVLFNTILRKMRLSKNLLNKKTAMISRQKLYFDNGKINSLLGGGYYPLEDTFLRSK